MERVLYSQKEGAGIICEAGEIIPVRKDSVCIVDEVIMPGTFTDLKGFYKRAVEYIGLDASNSDSKIMIFHLGSSKDLFPKSYYAEVLYLTPTRFYIQYNPLGGRDYNWNAKTGEWK